MTVPGASSVMPTYARYPLTLARGEGTRVWDDAGVEVLRMSPPLVASDEEVDEAATTFGRAVAAVSEAVA